MKNPGALLVHCITTEKKLLNKILGKDNRNINATLIFPNEESPQNRIFPAFKSLRNLRSDIFIAFNSNLLFYAGYTRNINSSLFFPGGGGLIANMSEKLHQETVHRKLQLGRGVELPYASWPKLTANQLFTKIRKNPVHYSDQKFLIFTASGAVKSKIYSQPLALNNGVQAHNEVHARATIANIESVIINQDQQENSEAVKLMSALNLKQKIEHERKMIVSHHSNNQPDRTLDYCVNIEILKIVTALQKIVLLKESLEHNKINKSTRNNRLMEASFSSKATKIRVEPSALNHEENYKQWLESQKEKIGKTIEEILAEINDRRKLFGIDDNTLKELVEFEESIVDVNSLDEENKKVKAKIIAWKQAKEKDPKLRKSLESLVVEELQKKVKIKLYSMKSNTLKLDELPELGEHVVYKEFITAGMKILDNKGPEGELKNFNEIFIDLNESAKKQIFLSAVRHGNDKIVRHLLNTDGSELYCQQCFSFAVELGNVQIADFLLKEKSIKLDEGKNFSYLFNYSIEKGNVEMAKFLIKNGRILGNKYSNIEVDDDANIEEVMNIMKKQESGYLGRALNVAIEKGSLNLVEYFLQIRKQHIYIQSNITYLQLAIEKNQTEVIKILLEKEASLVGEKYISNLLKLASEKNGHEVIRFLLAKEDGINLSDSPNLDLIHLAIKNGHEEVAKFLLEEEEKNGVRRENYANLFGLAIKNNRVEMAKFLSEKEESRGILRQDFSSDIQFAIKNNRVEMAKFLLEKEESRGILDQDFSRDIQFAIENNRVEMAKFLLEKEESRGIQRIDYNEMLLFATRKKYTSMCALFIKKGADFVVNFQNRALLSSIIDGAMIATNRVSASNNKEMEILALALNERGGEIKKLDLSKIYPNQTGRQSLKTKDTAILLFNDNVQCFFKAMRLPELQELDLNDNNLDSFCIDFVTKSSPKLKKLNLAGNDFFHKKTSSINNIFSKLVAIEDLDLSRNNIDFTKPKKIEGFITWLSNTRTLEKLNLSGNATENNVKSFCDIIEQNKLTELNISHNKIDEEGIKKIATSLATNSTLKILDLSGNNITPAGLQALYQALEKNNTLQSFGDIEINADIERILERNRQRHISQGGEDLQPASKRLRQSGDGGGASTADGGVARIEVGGGAQIGDGGGGSQNRGFEALRGERGVGQKRTYREALLSGPPSAIVSGGGGANLQSPAQSQSSSGPT